MTGAGHPPPLHVVMETARIAALQTYTTPRAPATEPFLTLVRITAHLLQAPVAMISFIDRDHQWIKAAFGTDLQQLPRSVSICSHVIAEPSGAMMVRDTLADLRFQRHPLVLAPPHIRFYASVCLVDSDGYVLGTLCVMDDKPSLGGGDELAILHKMGAETMDALARQRAEQAAWQGDAGSIGRTFNERRLNESWPYASASPAVLEPSMLRLPGPSWIGVKTEQTSVPGSSQGGRLLISIAADSPAERAGLRIGDVILAIDGHEARRRDDLTTAMASCGLGGVMRLHMLRDDRVFDRDIRPEPMPKQRLLQRRVA